MLFLYHQWRILLIVLLLSACIPVNAEVTTDQSDSILQVLESELNRNYSLLKAVPESEPLFYMQYQVVEKEIISISASYGSLTSSENYTQRTLDVDLRVGTPQTDNTHEIRSANGYDYMDSNRELIEIPYEVDAEKLRQFIWLSTDKAFKSAQERLIKVRTDEAVSVALEENPPDFTSEPPHRFVGPTTPFTCDVSSWEQKISAWSALFGSLPEVIQSSVSFSAFRKTTYYVNSEGTAIKTEDPTYQMMIEGRVIAEDGMNLYLVSNFFSRTENSLTNETEVIDHIKTMGQNLVALKNAPLVEPYVGPAILLGNPTAVFFHEIFGHRLEGHRQKSEYESKTFAKQIGKPILPDFIDIYDDPTMTTAFENDLKGHYQFDDEGVPAQRVQVVQQGVLKNFLLSRSPLSATDTSNGHGRRSPGNSPVSRQGILIIESSKTNTFSQLRSELVNLCKKQNKPYGLLFEDISGGFTQTDRYSTQGFKVIPLIVKKIFTDGRPDELVRGVDIVGTPLTAFSKIVAAGDDPTVFNGVCGAESGMVPVSVIAPSILVSEIEIAKKAKEQDKPPLLPPPVQKNTETPVTP